MRIATKTFLFSGLIAISAWSTSAFANLDDIQIASAKAAAFQMIEPEVKAIEAAYQIEHPGWTLSTLNLSAPINKIDYMVIEPEFLRQIFHLGDVTRVVVRAYILMYSPDGKNAGGLHAKYNRETGIFSRSCFRLLIDLKPNGEVVGIEENDFSNTMSYDPPIKYLTEAELHKKFKL